MECDRNMTGLVKKCLKFFELYDPTCFLYCSMSVVIHLANVCWIIISLSASFPKDLLITSERESISHVVDLDPLHGLLAALFADIQRLDHGLDVLLTGQLQHSQHFRPAADMASSHLGAIGGEILRHHRRQWLIWQADVVEFTVDVQRGHVLLDVELVSHVGAVEDEVEGVGPRFRPVLVSCTNEFLGAELEGVILLSGAVRERVDLGPKRRCPEQCEMTQSTSEKNVSRWGKAGNIEYEYSHSEDGNLLSWSNLCAYQRAPHGQTCTHHRSSIL